MIIPTYQLSDPTGRRAIEALLAALRLDPIDLALNRGAHAAKAAIVAQILADVAAHGDDAIADLSRKFDDSNFTVDQIRIKSEEMEAAAARVPAAQLKAIRRSISQVREYQQHCMPSEPESLRREGVELGLRFAPVDRVGLHVPGGKAAYPSSLIMLAVPAQVAGVKRIVVCTPPSRFGRSDLLLATMHELGLNDCFRAGGAGAIGAMAFGTATIPAVDKIIGPGNAYVQFAKRALAGCVGIDGFLGPSEILVLADNTGHANFIAADMLAQAEHDPGSCLLLTTSMRLARDVAKQLEGQIETLSRGDAILRALRDHSAIVVDDSMDVLIELANRFAAEHVNIQTADDDAIVSRLSHAGAIFIGPWSPVAAGDYIAGPSHCLPTNTTARFTSGISVYEFLKRSSVERYESIGLRADAADIIVIAEAEGLDAHAASIAIRVDAIDEA